MKDIMEVNQGEDLLILDSVVAKAGNVLSTQLGSLEYAPNFGVDLRFFLQSEFQFQNESFRAYLIQRLAEHLVNVSEVVNQIDKLSQSYTFSCVASEQSGGLIL